MSNISPNPLGSRLEHDNDPGAQALCSYKRSCEIAKPNSHADVIEATWRKTPNRLVSAIRLNMNHMMPRLIWNVFSTK